MAKGYFWREAGSGGSCGSSEEGSSLSPDLSCVTTAICSWSEGVEGAAHDRSCQRFCRQPLKAHKQINGGVPPHTAVDIQITDGPIARYETAIFMRLYAHLIRRASLAAVHRRPSHPSTTTRLPDPPRWNAVDHVTLSVAKGLAPASQAIPSRRAA